MADRVTGKHNAYFDVLDACKEGGCPICTLALAGVAHYLDAIFYESVNDPPTREGVTAAWGYCNDHSWQLRGMGAALGSAIMYRDVLCQVREAIARQGAGKERPMIPERRQDGTLRDRLTALISGTDSADGGHGISDPHIGCPACLMRERTELLFLAVLLEHILEEPIAKAFEASGGLCLVHLDQALGLADDKGGLQRLLTIQSEQLRLLEHELSEFLRKHDYRFKDEDMGTDGDSWIRAIALVAGKPGIR
jgi:hypothetical protein